MRIGIDASRATLAQRSGTEGYSLHIIRGLLSSGTEHEFILYFRDQPPLGLFEPSDNVSFQVIQSKRLWTHKALRQAVLKDRPDVLFVPAHVIPWPNTGGVPSVVTIHDLGYKHFPDKHPLGERLYLEWSTRHSATQARKIIVHSQATEHDLISLERIPRDKIRVVNAGVDELLKPVTDETYLQSVLQKYNLTKPYILHVGRMEPRKNLTRLVEAFNILSKEVMGLTLVFAGRYNEKYWSFKEAIQHLDDPSRVALTGYVPDADLSALFSGAAVYVFPSLYEGFGFPALEAMACGTPVVCSSTSSLPELVGEAALTVAPTDISAMAHAIWRVLTDEALRSEMRQKGLRQASLFTWEKCSSETMAVLLEVVKS